MFRQARADGGVRFLRVASLVAGVVVLVMAVAGIVGRRADRSIERDRQLETAAEHVVGRIDADLARVSAALQVATPDTTARDLADALGRGVCSVADGEPSCSAEQIAGVPALAVAAALLAANGQADPVAVVATTPSAPAGPAIGVLVAVDHGVRHLVVAVPVDTSALVGATTAELVAVGGAPLFRSVTVDGVRRYAAGSMVEFDDGPWAVVATTPAAVHLTSDERWLLGTQLVIGALLAALALGAMVVDHRLLERRAAIDGLTRLPNRAEFERRAREMLARLGRSNGRACLMVIDLDHFKAVNDTAGHDAGDRVLVGAADRLQHAVRESDLVGRWGGDEFVVLLPGVQDARAVPERARTIAAALAAAPAIGGRELSASVGAALFPLHGTGLEELLRNADRAMYAAKVQGVPHHVADIV